MIDKEILKNTESRLYNYYTQIKLIEKLKHKVVILWKQKEQIEIDIKNNNVEIEADLNMGMDYSREKIQISSIGTSYVEQEIIKAIDKLERELLCKKRKMLKLHTRIREMEEQIQDMQFNISMLDEESKKFLEWKYGEGKSVEWISIEMYAGARATAYRKREGLIRNVSQWCKFKM